MKKCKWCQYCYCPDSTDVSGLSCKKNSIIKIIDLDSSHYLCPGFKFSLFGFLFGV